MRGPAGRKRGGGPALPFKLAKELGLPSAPSHGSNGRGRGRSSRGRGRGRTSGGPEPHMVGAVCSSLPILDLEEKLNLHSGSPPKWARV